MIMVGDWAPGKLSVTLDHAADLWLGNLEGPILARGHNCAPMPKAGPHLSAENAPAGRWVLCGANNHLMDYGWEGVRATRNALNDGSATLVGVDGDVTAARQTRVISAGGAAVAIIACCEAQFGIASRAQPGGAVLGPWVMEAIRSAKTRADHVIVSCHAGLEDYAIPAPWLVELYRSWIDAGASIVHGHHAHVAQSFEAYKGGLIAYGLGNFAVDPGSWRSTANALWSLAFEVAFTPSGFSWSPLVFEIGDAADGRVEVRQAKGDVAAARLAHLERCNRILRDAALLEAVGQEVALHAFEAYGADFTGWRDLASQRRRRRGELFGYVVGRRKSQEDIHRARLLSYLMVNCESHRQMIATALGVLGGELTDRRSAASAAAFKEITGRAA